MLKKEKETAYMCVTCVMMYVHWRQSAWVITSKCLCPNLSLECATIIHVVAWYNGRMCALFQGRGLENMWKVVQMQNIFCEIHPLIVLKRTNKAIFLGARILPSLLNKTHMWRVFAPKAHSGIAVQKDTMTDGIKIVSVFLPLHSNCSWFSAGSPEESQEAILALSFRRD